MRGVVEHQARIDELLTATYSKGWTLSRMPAVDRNVLRIGVFELLWADDVPDPVAVTRRCTWSATCRPTSRRPSSTASSAPSSATRPSVA